MTIRLAGTADLDWLAAHDRHIGRDELAYSIGRGRVLLVEEGGGRIGWLRYHLFWDNTPFLNLLYLLEPWRGMGYGSRMMAEWEGQLRKQGYETALLSTPSDECSQHFYGKLGYRVIGGFLLGQDPYELMMAKQL